MGEQDFPKPCEVLVSDQWIPASLQRWYRWPDGSWRGAVTFRRWMTIDELGCPFGRSGDVPFWFTFEQSRRAEELRPAPEPSSENQGQPAVR